jgi:DNA-binding MarR family transcriptional regulator
MWREYDPRPHELEREDPSRGSRGGGDGQAVSTEHRDVFSRDLNLPRSSSRRPVRDREHVYELRQSEVRILATTGAFRVVPARELRDHHGKPADPREGDLRHLRELGLVHTIPHVKDGRRTTLVTLTERGRDLLESHRDRDRDEPRQAFYAGIVKPRELAHDAELYRAYGDASERLRDNGCEVKRVALDYELKGDYQRFLRDLNRERRRDQQDRDASDREREIAAWAREHDLPFIDGHVHFPDVRIEYERPDGRRAFEDVEVVTPHYRGAFAAAKGRTGFRTYRAVSGVGGRAGRGRRGLDPRLAEEFLP